MQNDKLSPEICLQAWFDGVDDEKVARYLQQWLGASEENLDRFIDQLDTHAGLHEEFGLETGMAHTEVRPVRIAGFRIWTAAAVAVIILGAGLILQSFSGADAQVKSGSGQEVYVLRGGKREALGSGDGVRPGDTVITAKGGQAQLLFDDGKTDVSLEGNTKLQLVQAGKVKELRLISGRMVAQVSSQKNGESLEVATQQANIMVVGTRFMLDAGSSQTKLLVLEGNVRVISRQKNVEAEVGSGEYAFVRSGGDYIEVGAIAADRKTKE